MPDAATWFDTLAEKSILSEPWLSPTTSPDVLAEPHIFILRAPDFPRPTLGRVMIRKRESDITVEIQVSDPMPQSLVKSVERVVDLLSLQAGWDSYSAKPIDPRNAICAIELLFQLLDSNTPSPTIVPTARGGIQLEWHTKGVNIEVYIDSPSDVTFFAEHLGSRESTEQSITNHQDELKSWVKRICEQ